ncbi:MAG: acyl-CoA dehydrogenase family protein [Aromatoleum sp.]|uniref:acyl-CoA dehydrogenase family protein n=1 Tax=Aromatoleum sp. TaxID=2307007 RepID=UPI00289394A1|nr:acyl-CoA dehydrogenase family protein [Aromatoleum sp.]MDT3670179.1 acyl-CoA dehydrogenase family protein [Aromatoleum sp.]
MNTFDQPEAEAFRAEVKQWLAQNAPAYIWGPGTSDEERFRLCRGWMAAKAAAGYAGITLPKKYGGRGGTPLEDVIFREEEMKVMNGSCDESFGGNLVGMAVPTILEHGQPGWAEKLIPKTLSGEYLWCQLFSEPGAGSDMAGFRTQAVRDGDAWVVNGQKIWTSGARHADWGLLLARTDPSLPKHKGLTFFLVDMKTPGMEVRPLKQISGRADFNEVFFTDVRIPDSARVGEVNGGWKVALTTMMNERLTLLSDPSTCRDVLEPLIRLGKRIEGVAGGTVADESAFREKIAGYYVVIAGMRRIRARLREALGKGNDPGPEPTIGKVTVARWLQEIAAYAMDLAGPSGQAIDVEGKHDLAIIQEAYFLVIGYRIGGGTEEIAKNIIAERLLGLPQDPRPDKEVPFNQVPSGESSRGRAPAH